MNIGAAPPFTLAGESNTMSSSSCDVSFTRTSISWAHQMRQLNHIHHCGQDCISVIIIFASLLQTHTYRDCNKHSCNNHVHVHIPNIAPNTAGKITSWIGHCNKSATLLAKLLWSLDMTLQKCYTTKQGYMYYYHNWLWSSSLSVSVKTNTVSWSTLGWSIHILHHLAFTTLLN